MCLLLEGVDGVQELDLLVRPRVQHVTDLNTIIVVIIITVIIIIIIIIIIMTHYGLELYAGEGPGSGAGGHLGVHLEGVQPRPHRVTHGGEGAVLRLLETDSTVA